jgi:hypothetical protein
MQRYWQVVVAPAGQWPLASQVDAPVWTPAEQVCAAHAVGGKWHDAVAVPSQ